MAVSIDGETGVAASLFVMEENQFGSQSAHARKLLRGLTIDARGLCSRATGLEWATAILSRFLFRNRGFRFGCSDRGDDFTLTGTLLNRSGNCLGLTTLFCAVAGELALPVSPLLFEGHIAACIELGCQRKLIIELSRGGIFLQGRLARLMYGPLENARALNDEEFLAVHMSNRASFVLAHSGQSHQALEMLNDAIELFPDYCGARINRACLLLELGLSEQAADEVERVFDLHPQRRYHQMAANLLKEIAWVLVSFRQACPAANVSAIHRFQT